MGLFSQSASKLPTGGPTLLMLADPGSALLDAARLYDPSVRHSKLLGRLVFSNGVLLDGPVKVTPMVAQQVGNTGAATVAWYARAALRAVGDRYNEQRSHEEKEHDGERLVRGLAARLGGSTYPARLQPKLALLASVYSEQELAAEQVISALRPWGGALGIEEAKEDSYSLGGKAAPFYVAYWSPRVYRATDAPPALGPMRSRPLHHWDIHSGVRASDASHELCLKVGEAALSLGSQAGGPALDMFGFRISSADDLLPR